MSHPVSSSAISNPNPVKVRAIFKAKVNRFRETKGPFLWRWAAGKERTRRQSFPSFRSIHRSIVPSNASIDPLKRHRCRHRPALLLSFCRRSDRVSSIPSPPRRRVTPLPPHARIDFSFFFIYRPRRREPKHPSPARVAEQQGVRNSSFSPFLFDRDQGRRALLALCLAESAETEYFAAQSG